MREGSREGTRDFIAVTVAPSALEMHHFCISDSRKGGLVSSSEFCVPGGVCQLETLLH